MRRRIAVFAMLLALGAASAASAQAAAEPQVDPAKLELARQLYAAIGGEEAFKAQMNAMLSGMSQVMKSVMPAGNEKLTNGLMSSLQESEMEMIPQLIDISARVYAENLTEQELRDMLAWSRTPSAQSIRVKMPAVTQQLMIRMGPMMQAMMPKMAHKALDRACDEAQCTPEVRQRVAQAVDKALQGKGS